MADDKKARREVQKHFLPNSYKGRCTTAGKVISQFLTFKKRDLKEGEILHKFELRLPVPTTNDEAMGFYGLTLDQIIERGVEKTGNDLDKTVTAALFKDLKLPTDASTIKPAVQLSAQKKADEWKYTPRTGSGKSTKVSEVVAKLVEKGILPKYALDTITTNDELQKAIASIEL